MDRSKLIAALVERLEVKIDQDDPAFVLVELNALVFEELVQPLLDRLDEVADSVSGLSKLSNLPKRLDEKSAALDEQITRLNASKEILIAEIAVSVKKKLANDIEAGVNSTRDRTAAIVNKMLTKHVIVLAVLLIGVQIALKFV